MGGQGCGLQAGTGRVKGYNPSVGTGQVQQHHGGLQEVQVRTAVQGVPTVQGIP